jgi:hypothetical protein
MSAVMSNNSTSNSTSTSTSNDYDFFNYTIALVIVFLAVILGFGLSSLFKIYCQNVGEGSNLLSQNITKEPLKKQHYIAIGETKFKRKICSLTKENESASGANECPVCLSAFVDEDVIRKLPPPCGHTFHKHCIDQWFHKSAACPMCKRSIYDILEGDVEGHVVECAENRVLSS